MHDTPLYVLLRNMSRTGLHRDCLLLQPVPVLDKLELGSGWKYDFYLNRGPHLPMYEVSIFLRLPRRVEFVLNLPYQMFTKTIEKNNNEKRLIQFNSREMRCVLILTL